MLYVIKVLLSAWTNLWVWTEGGLPISDLHCIRVHSETRLVGHLDFSKIFILLPVFSTVLAGYSCASFHGKGNASLNTANDHD